MKLSFKGFFIFAFSLMMFNIGLVLNGVDKNVVHVCSLLLSIFAGPYFISGKIFEGEEKIDE